MRDAARLQAALLGYFVLVTAVITLSPFDFQQLPLEIYFYWWPSDLAANIAMFLPIGFLLRSLDRTPGASRWRTVRRAAAFSLLIEIAQVFLPGRYVSPFDLFANACGAWIGAAFRDRAERWAMWHPGVVNQIGLDIPLVGLLYLLVPQLWLSSVGLIEEPFRSVTTLLLGCAGSIVLVALYRHRWQGGARLAANVVTPLALLWFLVGVLPALAASPQTFAVLALTVVLITLVLLRQPPDPAERRFELDTLRRFFPVFGLYLVVATLWPPLRPLVAWHGSLGFVDRLNNAGLIDVLKLLEQVGGFTLLGYAVAEWRGRRDLRIRADLARVTLFAAMAAVLLELAQGLLAGPGASLLRALLATSGSMYGAAVYHLARAHVRALRAAASGLGADEPPPHPPTALPV